MAEKQAELEGERITEGELGTKVKVNGTEIYAHVAWANRVEKLAKAIPDNNNLLVVGCRRQLPPTLKALVSSSNDTWTTFCKAVRAIRPLDIEEEKERQDKQARIEGELQRVRQQQRQTPQTPSSALGQAFRSFSVGPIPQPRFQPAATNNQGQSQQYKGPQRTDAEKLDLIRRILPPHPDTATGWAAYEAEVTAWNRNNYGRAAHETRPYPLTPGTSPVASGECFGCGKVGHISAVCTTNTRIPEAERTWRQKANSIRAGANAASRTTNPNVNLVAEDDVFVSREEYDAAVITRAIRKLDAERMAQYQGGDIGAYVLVRERVGHEDLLPEPADFSDQLTVSDVCEEDVELKVVDLYAVRAESDETQKKGTKPFIHQVKLHGPKGEVVRVWGLFDNGAMVDAMSTETYNRVRHRLSPLGRSNRRLRMANGNIVNPIGCWKGTVELGDTTVKGSFEVFDSGSGWDFLFGKTLMTAFEAVHNYAVDEVLVPQHQLTLQNQHDIAKRHDVGRTSEAQNKEKKRETKKGDKAQSPVRGVPTNHINRELQTIDTHMIVTTLLDMEPQMQVAENPEESKHEIIAKEHKDKEKRASEERLKKQQSVEDEERQYLKKQAKERAKQMWTTWKGPSQRRHRRWKTRNTNIMRAKQEQAQGGIKEPPAREVPEHDSCDKTCPTDTTDEVFNQPTVAPVCIISEDTTETTADHTTEIPTDGLAKDTTNVFTRMTDPFKPARVEEIQRQVTIGNDLTSTENAQAQALITEFADIFALSVSEVKQVEGAVHRLNIDPNAKFSTKVHQKPLTPPQRRYLYEKLQAMLDADVIEPCEPGQVKCVSPTTLAQKTHEGAGLTLDELQHRVNDECVHANSDEVTTLRERFKDVPILLEVIDALLELDQGTSLRKRKRAHHRASEYMIENGKLWRVATGHRTRARARVECVSPEEAVELARSEHAKNGHWQRDSIKKTLLDRIWSPGLDGSIVAGIKDCSHCKNFGERRLGEVTREENEVGGGQQLAEKNDDEDDEYTDEEQAEENIGVEEEGSIDDEDS
ncbi:hypothetical protein K443DRAFT_654402 [Laccaria amethystina LaAM-08-1]|uniref:CCHC-type domain-containing protein n=1 Tax=Laccaria amethystina LaAM-08-1 TaxID=1095629 RepID=A0A0C9X1N2_9AGAR|nr:hypothetical protein K443DRAFT_654402 [Laccaria amethystina LaAM-08-1]